MKINEKYKMTNTVGRPLRKNYAGAKAVHNLLHVSGLASCLGRADESGSGRRWEVEDEISQGTSQSNMIMIQTFRCSEVRERP